MSIATGIRKLFRPSRAIVLMYHRIAEPQIDPWQLAVSKKNFRDHLQVLSASGKVISTQELIECVRNKKLESDCFCITSDDGYQDNFLHAFPLIEEYECPATFFIASGKIGSNEPYWWDLMTDIFLSTKKLPGALDISVNNKRFSYALDNNGEVGDRDLTKHSTWCWPQTPPTQRCEIYLELWMYLRDQPSQLINDTMKQLKNWSGVEAVNNAGSFPMSNHELKQLSDGKYAATGVHTVSHIALSAFPKSVQRSEIDDCRQFLDGALGGKHSSIAFPYGNYNSETLDVVKEIGLQGAFTTNPKPVTIKSDVFQLGRYQVINQTGEQFKKQLHHWLNN